MRVALQIEYSGEGFSGWQTQPDGRGGQDALERALGQVAECDRVATICAGRTDTGVHATAQVVHFDSDVSRPLSAWVRGTNTHLPPNMAVRWAQAVSPDFHARFDARARHYRYILLSRSTRPALLVHRVGWYHAPLDVGRMQEAAQYLLGEHDFSTFRAAQCQAKSPIRTLFQLTVQQHQDFFIFDLCANAFLHHMVRNIVGTLVYVGKGKYPPSWVRTLLKDRDRKHAAPTFSAAGLYFVGVDYDATWGLPCEGKLFDPPPLLMVP